MKLRTSEGWVSVPDWFECSDVVNASYLCSDCGEPATCLVEIDKDVAWAQCIDCASETDGALYERVLTDREKNTGKLNRIWR
jgi:DNA-directed RNA polymerase subunit RPC12/RpoP